MCSKDIVFARHGTTDIGLDNINVTNRKKLLAKKFIAANGDFANDNDRTNAVAAAA